MVGVQGFEPWTPCSQSRCATRLRYTPTEPIFYTERAIAGKSCKIRAMSAYFSSKFTKQIQVALSVALLILCLLGTRWVGLSHHISHAHVHSQTEASSVAVDTFSSANHSSDVCHLFDALTLAGFIGSDPATSIVYNNVSEQSSTFNSAFISIARIENYQSRAPPILLS